MKKTIIIAFNLLILIGCQTKKKKELIIDKKPIQSENRKETKIYGDSLKVIFEYRGDSVIQKRIDLKGTSDDNFDSSFTVISVFSTRESSELDCQDQLILKIDSLDFKYCYQDIFGKIKKDILIAKKEKESWQVERLNKTKNILLKYKKNGKADLVWIKEFYIYDLLREINFEVYDERSKSKVKKVRIEKYETSFSGGRYYYFINKMNDTIAINKIIDWIR